ncbi:MAG: DUF5615 family PIN-like protein [Bacteroidia bacterium]
MIIVDENIEEEIINVLRHLKIDFVLIREDFSGIDDSEIVEMAIELNGIILTKDKDFGELFFSHGLIGSAVIFIRNKPAELKEIIVILRNLFSIDLESFRNKFTVITTKKIRERNL